MEGNITSYTGTSMQVTMDVAVGSTSFIQWNFVVAGVQGTTGAQGTLGAQGTIGQSITGTQGAQGNNGATGQSTTGPQGIQGFTGYQGATGTGTQGATGGPGSQGAVGQSITGPQGAQGNNGATGQATTGPQGIQGFTGYQGASGTNGTNGSNGSQGATGATGAQGYTGTGFSAISPAYSNAIIISNGTSNSGFTNSSIYVSGNTIYADAFYQNSSRALKTNITPFDDNAIDLLKRVSVVTFYYNNDLFTPHIGFIAEDTPMELSGVNQNMMDVPSVVGTLIKAVQELQVEIDELKAR